MVGHEYFHNWTGNRVTCRDWFQLSLKEGLTVFRDQEFSSDLNSRAVERIAAVEYLRREQFPEDAGPMAHNVRPDEYLEINNFYTATVYEKGAEVIRMQHTLLGPERFRRGMDLYFERHDGMAVTCDDFVQAMQRRVAASTSRSSSAGTARPARRCVAVAGRVTTTPRRPTRSTSRSDTPPTPGQPDKEPFHIPFAVGLVDADGRDIPLRLDGEAAPVGTTRVLDVRAARQSFRFAGIAGAAGAVAAARLLGAGQGRLPLHRRRARVPRRARQRCRSTAGTPRSAASPTRCWRSRAISAKASRSRCRQSLTRHRRASCWRTAPAIPR